MVALHFESALIEKILTRAADRVPLFENLAVNPKRAWAGLYKMTPDHHRRAGCAVLKVFSVSSASSVID